jgi:hypothetical protein
VSNHFAHAPTQAAEFSGPGREAIALYTPQWTETLLDVLRRRPTAYEAAWQFNPERRAHLLQVEYEGGPQIQIALIDGIHNAVIARLAGGAALVLSPYPLYPDPADQGAAQRLFSPEESLVLPKLPSPLEL